MLTDHDGTAPADEPGAETAPLAPGGRSGVSSPTVGPVLPARRVAVLARLRTETDMRLRWDVDTGWAALATAGPTDSGKPRFLGFAELAASSTGYEERVAEVLDALCGAGFTVLADLGEVRGLRETWIRFRESGADSDSTAPPAPIAGVR